MSFLLVTNGYVLCVWRRYILHIYRGCCWCVKVSRIAGTLPTLIDITRPADSVDYIPAARCVLVNHAGVRPVDSTGGGGMYSPCYLAVVQTLLHMTYIGYVHVPNTICTRLTLTGRLGIALLCP